jgi:hypothetical protein
MTGMIEKRFYERFCETFHASGSFDHELGSIFG